MTGAGSSYKGFRFPPEIIGHCVWLYHRFPLSFRDVQELMLERGVDVSYETIRAWCDRFGQEYANQLRRRGPRPGDKWHLDEVFVQINGAQRYLWRAVDQHGNVLDILVQSRRNAVAAKKFFRRLLKGLRYVPRVIVTDKLASYQVAHRELVPSVQHRRSKYLNNGTVNLGSCGRSANRISLIRHTRPGESRRRTGGNRPRIAQVDSALSRQPAQASPKGVSRGCRVLAHRQSRLAGGAGSACE